MTDINKHKETLTHFFQDKPKTNEIIIYGSKINSSIKDETKQLDCIIGVDNKKLWHKEIYTNQKDYYPSKIGYHIIKNFHGFFTTIDYLVYLPADNNFIKLGIINSSDLHNTLNNWHDFPTAGRLQKPVHILKNTPHLDIAYQKNILNAFKYNLLLLNKEKISQEELFISLINMSYNNSFRVLFKLENTNKATNILSENYDFFKETYLPNDYGVINNDHFIVDIEKLHSTIVDNNTPETLKKYILENKNYEISKIISSYLKHAVLPASTELIVRGTLLNGIAKTSKYGIRKRKKYLDSL